FLGEGSTESTKDRPWYEQLPNRLLQQKAQTKPSNSNSKAFPSNVQVVLKLAPEPLKKQETTKLKRSHSRDHKKSKKHKKSKRHKHRSRSSSPSSYEWT